MIMKKLEEGFAYLVNKFSVVVSLEWITSGRVMIYYDLSVISQDEDIERYVMLARFGTICTI